MQDISERGGGYCEDNLSKAEGRHQTQRLGSAAMFSDDIQCTFHWQGNLSELVVHPEDCSSSAQPQIVFRVGHFSILYEGREVIIVVWLWSFAYTDISWVTEET